MRSQIRIPAMRPTLPPLHMVEPYLDQMYANGRFSNFGPLNNAFEARLAELIGVDPKLVVTCSSATTGLIGAMQLASEPEFLVPNFTFAAGAHAVLAAGKRIELTDIQESNWKMKTPVEISKEQGIQFVFPFGSSINLSEPPDAKTVVIDAAASIGALPHALSNLREGWSVVFSLHATKVLGIGEGGFLLFGSVDQANNFRQWSNFGFGGVRQSAFAGTNAKLSEISAAFGLAALDNWDIEKEEWLAARNLVLRAEADAGFALSKNFDNPINPYWNIELENEELAEKVINHLALEGIETRRWWMRGLSTMPAFAEFGKGDYQVTKLVSGRTIGLPFFRGITKPQVDAIVSALEKSLNC